MIGAGSLTFKQNKKELLIRCGLVIFSSFLIALSIVLMEIANLGESPVSIFCEGIHYFFNMSFGRATNIANFGLFIFLCIFARKYINIGAFLNIISLGVMINFIEKFSNILNLPNLFIVNFIRSVVGCLILFFGVALFISANIGVDVWTAVPLWVQEKLNKSFRFVKVSIDIVLVILGVLMGGKLGISTIIAMVLGGPLIQMFTKITNKFVDAVTKN